MELKRIEPEEAKALLDSGEGYVYLDVRTKEEFAAGHVPDAVNIPLLNRAPAGMAPNPNFVAQVSAAFAKSDRLITGCSDGTLSMKAAQFLIASGFEHVVDMRGGFSGESDFMGNVTVPGWALRGLPATTD